MGSGDIRSRRPSPRWNLISLMMPAFGFLVAWLSWVSGLFEMLRVGSHPMHQGAVALAVWLAFGPSGAVAAIVSLLRSEQLRGITVTALLLNGLLAVGFLALGGFAGDARDSLLPFVALACAALGLAGFFWSPAGHQR